VGRSIVGVCGCASLGAHPSRVHSLPEAGGTPFDSTQDKPALPKALTQSRQNMCAVSRTNSSVDVFAFPRSYSIRCETMM
jgi:hypothetical protein